MRDTYKTRIAPYLDVIGDMAASGIEEEEIRAMLQVDREAWERYTMRYAPLRHALQRGRMSTYMVEAALRRRAMGYSYQECTRELRAVPDGQGGTEQRMVVTKVVEKERPPDLAALRLWLSNRAKDRWQEECAEAQESLCHWSDEALQQERTRLRQALDGEEAQEQ
nr:hypothetical protein [Maliibacterium massiliense]